jgi:class 3 adenylate cyclase/tetratricopeptide (TPR) repeat protein
MSELDEQADEVKAAIAGLEARRSLLGDAVVEPALTALRQQLSQLDLASDDERKVVTVLFADVSGFTAWSEKLDPEEVRTLINACFECLVPVVQKYQGTIDKFIGDEIMALFGAPAAHENDPERALRAALEMMDAIIVFNRQHATNLTLHIGTNTGGVIAGKIGAQNRQDYSVMGDAVNLAARLKDASPNGQIFVGSNTHRQTAQLFDFAELPPLKLKGKTEAIKVHRLIGLKAAPKPVRGIEGLHSPIVGRETEMEKIGSTFSALRKGHGSILALVGEAGLGKSRLVTEALQSLATDVAAVEGRALSYASSMTYWMARDVLRGLFGLKEDTPLAQVEAALRNSVELTLPENVANVYPYLARLLDIPTDEATEERVKFLTSEALQKRILQAFHDYVCARATRRPLILIWEDLHWCDPSSLRVLEMLLPLVREVPLLILLIYRPDESLVEQLHEQARAAYPEQYHLIELSPLTRHESGSLIQNLLKIENLSREMRELILDRADGNPFFLEELLRSLLDAGIVSVQQDRVTATRAIKPVDVPETLQGVLMARIDRLAPEKKHALQNASVIGRIFQKRVLARLYREKSNSKKRLDDSLVELQRREFIQSRAQKTSEESALLEHEYIFKHAITHDVAYNSLLVSRRRELHKLTGKAIESLFPDRLKELSSTLGYHFQKGEAHENAAFYLGIAADRAKATFANAEAAAFYRSAIEQIAKLRERNQVAEQLRDKEAQLHESLGDVLALSARQEDARIAYANARAGITEPVWRSRLERKLGSTYILQRQFEKTLEIYRTAETALGEKPPGLATAWWIEWVQIQLDRLLAYYWLGSTDEMNVLAAKSKTAVEQQGTPLQRGQFFNNLALSELRRHPSAPSDIALRYAEMAVAATEGSADLPGLSHIGFTLGFIHMLRGNLEDGERHLQASLQLSERTGEIVIQARCLTYLTTTYRRAGRPAETREYLSPALKLATELKMVEYIAMARANLAWLQWRDGDFPGAKANATTALDLWHSMPDPYSVDWMALLPLIAVTLAEGNVRKAMEVVPDLLGENQHPLPQSVAASAKEAIEAWKKKETKIMMGKLEELIQRSKQIGYL